MDLSMPLRVGCSRSLQTTSLETPCIANLSLALRSDNRPLSARVQMNTSFRQASRTTCAAWIQARSTRCSLNSVCLAFPFRLDVVGIIRRVLNLSSISHGVIDLSSIWAKCFVSKSAGFSHPGTFAMVSARRATASCTHKDLGMKVSHSSPLRAARLSPSTPWRPLVHMT